MADNDEGTFLGSFEDEYVPKSIFNKFGNYGSQFSSTSIFNQFASHPPSIVDDEENIYGRLSINRHAKVLLTTVTSLQGD